MLNGVYPHNSASVVEVETGDIYVIDSYIYANGEEPDIRVLDSWLDKRVEEEGGEKEEEGEGEREEEEEGGGEEEEG